MVLEHADCPEMADQLEQKVFSLFVTVTILQFAGKQTQCDTSYPASQLARFCASAGQSHWAALHHLMGYIESLTLTYYMVGWRGFDGFTDSDWGSSVPRGFHRPI
jgi:hypothetical protein